MRLLKLYIENITSLRQATIDFTASPLANSELFLICGDIGTGKSTILDCICLALFNNTPRMNNWQSSGRDDSDDDVSEKSTQQLLRRGAGSALVSLDFESEDGTLYKAEWSVQRAHKKADGKIQSEKWSLQYEKDGRNVLITKKNELRKEIPAIIGLDFEQFCRTSMLAQGDFTRFLNSKDDDKAAILEKITGTAIYSEMGKRIFQHINGIQAECDSLSARLSDVKTLSGEEVLALREELTERTNQATNEEQKSKFIQEKLQWLVNDKLFKKEVIKAASERSDIMAEAASDERQSRLLSLRLLRETAHARSFAAEAVVLKNEKHTLESRREYILKTAGSLAGISQLLKENLELSETRLKKLENKIKAFSPLLPLIEKKDIILEKIDGLFRLEKETALAAENLSLAEKDIKVTEKEILEPAIIKLQNKRTLLSEAKQAMEEAEKSLADMNEAGVNLNLEKCSDRLILLNECLDTLNNVKSEQEAIRNASLLAESYQTQLKEERTFRTSQSEMATAMRTLLDQAEKDFEIISRSTAEWTQELRAHLHTGDRCPVCDSLIESAIPAEESFRKRFEEKKSALDHLKSRINSLENSIHNSDIKIASLSTALETAQKRLEETERLNLLNAKLEELSKREGILDITLCSKAIEDSQKSLDSLHDTLKTIQECKKKVNDARHSVDSLSASADKLAIDSEKIKESIEYKRHEQTRRLAILNEKREELSARKREVEDLRNTLDVNSSSLPEEEFRIRLIDAVEKYSASRAEMDETEKNCRALAADWEAIVQIKNRFSSMIKDVEIVPSTSKSRMSTSELKDQWLDICSKYEVVCTSIAEKENKIKSLESDISSAISAHDISEATFAEICQLPPEIEKELSDLESLLEKRLSEGDGVLTNARNLLCSHYKERPDISQDDSIDSLRDMHEHSLGEIRHLSARIGEIKNILKNDTLVHESIKTIEAQLNSKRKLLDKWNRLSDFSDAQGKKFKRIAQSYILGSLVHSANHYLDMLSGRYRISHGTGSFTLFVEDAWEGYARRPASTISGGESFLVSLSLALAITDFSGSFHTDTLFIDEGFGSLSGNALTRAIEVLRRLHSLSGRRVGIISHLPSLKEEVAVQIRLNRAPGSSATSISIEG